MAIRVPQLNKIILCGRLVRSAELRRTQTGKAVVSFTVAATRAVKTETGVWEEKEKLFLECALWGQAAEDKAPQMTKGTPVFLEGRLFTHTYAKDDGTTISQIRCNCNSLQILKSKEKEENSEEEEEPKQKPKKQKQSAPPPDDDDDELPF